MTYIHDSALRSHGNLKSSNCLIDSRWVVKITDFGLHELKYGADPEPEDVLDFEQQCESEYQNVLRSFFGLRKLIDSISNISCSDYNVCSF